MQKINHCCNITESTSLFFKLSQGHWNSYNWGLSQQISQCKAVSRLQHNRTVKLCQTSLIEGSVNRGGVLTGPNKYHRGHSWEAKSLLSGLLFWNKNMNIHICLYIGGNQWHIFLSSMIYNAWDPNMCWIEPSFNPHKRTKYTENHQSARHFGLNPIDWIYINKVTLTWEV